MKAMGKHRELFDALRQLYQDPVGKALCLEGCVIPGGHVIVGMAKGESGPLTIFEIRYDGETHLLVHQSSAESWRQQRELIERLVTDHKERVMVGFALMAGLQQLSKSLMEMAAGGGSPPSEPSSSP